ncbi:TMEM175 family protein [Streptomyces sp. NBC_00243]|uniref:TMEM175 family protein n=1 Tax=Streptomyces sp. NBC_00243 TaxID=2975688 RepID=UPI002DDA9C6B|nr:TMEM175 family protein [Streptomyces sp. NBC_00243]WRZ17470.1 TMEM175 family protein [Streptomyces sp. NBC_00243]
MNNRTLRLPRRETVIGAERLLFFGDAVFAIAITLLALDITVPEGLADSEVGAALRDAVPKMGAYLLSFAVIGVLWLAQHALFRLVATLDRWLLNLYLALLAVVAALPFPTRLISEYGDTTAGTAFYAANIALAIALLAAMTACLLVRPSLAVAAAEPGRIRDSLRRSLFLFGVFATSIPVAFASPTAAKYWWLLAILSRLLIRGPKTPDQQAPEVTGTTA